MSEKNTITLTDDEIALLGAALDLYIDDRETFVPMPEEIKTQIATLRALCERLAAIG